MKEATQIFTAMAGVDNLLKVRLAIPGYMGIELTLYRTPTFLANESWNRPRIPVRLTKYQCLVAYATSPPTLSLTPYRAGEIYKYARRGDNGRQSRRSHLRDDHREKGDVVALNPTGQEHADNGLQYPLPDGEDDDDDDEGRFFGSGISKMGEEILDFVDEQAKDATVPDRIDRAWLRRTALNFEKRITKNAELRVKLQDEPQRFIESEADLDADIKALSILAEHPELYQEFVDLGCAASLVSLLAHENTDIAIDVVEIIGELTDEDVGAEDEQWQVLVGAMTDADLISLLVSNLSRLDEEDEADRDGVYHVMHLVENICSRVSTAERIGRDDNLLQWLLGRTQRKESPVTQNKQYAAEVLAIIAEASAENRRRLAALDAVDVMLQLVSPYRKRDPEKGSEEEEYMENIFEGLTCIVDEPEGKAKFVEAEGVELCLIILKEGRTGKAPALRLLDHAVVGAAAALVCQRVVQSQGLKPIFTTFMKKSDSQSTEHLVGIFASMLRLLPAQSAERIRTLAKFVEKDYEKTEKLLKLRGDYASRVNFVDKQIQSEQAQEGDADEQARADQQLSRRLDAGLFSLQTIDVVLAWLIAEDDGAKGKITSVLADRGESLSVIKDILSEQLEGLDPGAEDSSDTRDMLTTLMGFL